MNIHEQIIKCIVDNEQNLQWIIGMYNTKIKTDVSMGEYGDIDILVYGIDVNTQKDTIAVIEVKSHKGLVDHYVRHQLVKYVERFPAAKQFVAYAKSEKIVFENIEIEQLK